jgi:hypothetical protein
MLCAAYGMQISKIGSTVGYGTIIASVATTLAMTTAM